MNHSDSERMAAVLEKHNFKPTPSIGEADLVVFNTCGVRQMAEDRVYGQIHNVKRKAQSKKRKIKIIVTGCLANRKDVQRRLRDKVDLFCETKDFHKKFRNMQRAARPKITNTPNENIAYLSIRPKHANKHSAYVPIMTGCNNFCAYCVVPYARGREVSRPASEILLEVRSLVKKGCREITLLGQNVNSYNDGKNNFPQLLKKIDSIPGKFWIRFISNHPKDVTEEMIETAAKCEKVCECFHLPIQSGNDEIIKKMNRKYTAKQYLKLVKKIKAAYKKYKPTAPYAITSDIIIGFPGETKRQFMDSAEIMKKVEYDMAFFGQYSPRPGTAAWKMKNNVSKTEKARREKYLNEILKKTSLENNKKYVGKFQEILVEKKKDGFYFGKTRTTKNVKVISKKKNIVGKFKKVKIIHANAWNLEGSC